MRGQHAYEVTFGCSQRRLDFRVKSDKLTLSGTDQGEQLEVGDLLVPDEESGGEIRLGQGCVVGPEN